MCIVFASHMTNHATIIFMQLIMLNTCSAYYYFNLLRKLHLKNQDKAEGIRGGFQSSKAVILYFSTNNLSVHKNSASIVKLCSKN